MKHDFFERLAFSEGVDLPAALVERLMDGIPNAQRVVRAGIDDDRQGIDYWISRSRGLPPVAVDVKHRSECPIAKGWGDDACIETTSVYEGPSRPPWSDAGRRKPGWTIDGDKQTELLVYTWPAGDKRRFWILYFPHLCRAAQENWREWARRYGERPAFNDGYATLCTYPPRSVIAAAMRRLIVGVA